MADSPRICVLIPVYNHALTLEQVITGARRHLPVIVVNDGSTDATAAVLARQTDIEQLALPVNQGKGAALRAGFEHARTLGFTHVVTLDADGQLPPDELPGFAAACQAHPDALLVGVRNFRAAGAPAVRRRSNLFSNFWFRFETGQALRDTQCGYRCYPLDPILQLPVRAGRYAYELEVLVLAAWAGVPLVPHPVGVDYAAPTSRLSHFRPGRDLFQVSLLHSRLSMQAFCLPAPLRRLMARGAFARAGRGERVRTVLRELFTEHTETPGRISGSVALGLFWGIAPVWGFQMLVAALCAHRLRLNKAITLASSNISFPLAAPFILAAGLLLGHWARTGQRLPLDPEHLRTDIALHFWDWFVGSLLLALLVAAAGGALAWILAWVLKPGPQNPNANTR